MAKNTIQDKIRIKAIANKWMSDNLNSERTLLSLSSPKRAGDIWAVELLVKNDGCHVVGTLCIDSCGKVVESSSSKSISANVERLTSIEERIVKRAIQKHPEERGFFYEDGISASALLQDKSVDLLLTDPPYSISNAYTCQQQIPRRLRSNGSDFIMPKGDFGEWDHNFNPQVWTEIVLPKVSGWAVIFCAQAQIAEYSDIFERHKFNAIGTIVWHKTNPVPFNHKFKPVNAWEAGVIAKRPGTKFHGQSVHNVFKYKSPSPQHRIHPTQKPIELVKRLVELFSDTGELVLDPFAGSGTTARAAMELRREVIAYENNAEYYDAACMRLSAVQLSI